MQRTRYTTEKGELIKIRHFICQNLFKYLIDNLFAENKISAEVYLMDFTSRNFDPSDKFNIISKQARIYVLLT